VRSHPLWRRLVLRRNSRSGIPGVVCLDRLANANTGRRAVFWIATWVDERGSSRQHKFAASRYGEDHARALAIAERKRQLRISVR